MKSFPVYVFRRVYRIEQADKQCSIVCRVPIYVRRSVVGMRALYLERSCGRLALGDETHHLSDSDYYYLCAEDKILDSY